MTATEHEPAVANRGRILVVDDDDRNRRLLDALLVPEGYEVIAAESGARALTLIAEHRADLVLLDVMMPELDGIETCRRIREELGERVLPVIFVTALGDRDARVRGKIAGGDEFLSKPIDEVELLVRVRNLLHVKAYHDMRERQRELLEAELERRTALWLHAERLASLGTLASAVGHELNNVNSVLVSYLRFVRERAATGLPADAKDIDALTNMTEHLRVHARHLLDLGRPANDEVGTVDVGELAESVNEMLRSIGRLKHATVRVDRPRRPLLVRSNRGRLEQVLINLLGNAADAVSGVSGRERVVETFVRETSGRVLITVRDNGCGIAAHEIERVFEPYFTTKPTGRGTGLGLVVVKQIVESFGGSVRIESRAGEQTLVTVDLPALQS
jgi:C4-dicarboxylate-specific signal transduction histidine kinase